MVIALAGRRIDAPESPDGQFPSENISLVREQLRELFSTYPVNALVCSAACGADLLALDEAGCFGISRHIILPFEPQRFRETSVADRPGEWGRLYDEILAEVAKRQQLIVLVSKKDDGDAYAAVNDTVLNEAAAIASKLDDRVAAVLVWNGVSRGDDDLTQAFGEKARARGFEVMALSTGDAVSQKAKPL